MKIKNFLEDESVFKAYDRWIYSPTLFSHLSDRQYFYQFVERSVYFVKHILFVKRKEAWRTIDMDVFKEHLCKRFSELKENNYPEYEEKVHEILCNFEMLIEYEKTKDPVLRYI
ncbi:MAG: hypothetical protein JW845_08415 [Dehalococcoidales bacterium]|nr:hypothetical protein [Dehalococcoidales bacterium]